MSEHNRLYFSVGISTLIVLIFLFVPWLVASNGSVNTVELWRSIDNIDKLASTAFSSVGTILSSEDRTLFRISLIVAFIVPVLLTVYIIKSLQTKKMSRTLAKCAALIGFIICPIWMGLSLLLAESKFAHIPLLFVLMKSNDAMDALESISGMFYGARSTPSGFSLSPKSSFPIGAAQFITLVLLIINSVIIGKKPKATSNFVSR